MLLVATGYQIAYAAGLLEIGALPGQGPPGYGWVLLAALLAMLLGAIFSFSYVLGPWRVGVLAAALAPAAGAFVTARYYTFDPYFAPSLRCFSEGGTVSPEWVFGLLIAAVLAGLCTRWQSVPGLVLTSIVLVVGIFTALVQGTH